MFTTFETFLNAITCSKSVKNVNIHGKFKYEYFNFEFWSYIKKIKWVFQKLVLPIGFFSFFVYS